MPIRTGYDEVPRELLREEMPVRFLGPDNQIIASGDVFHCGPMVPAGPVEAYDKRERTRTVILLGHIRGVALNSPVQLRNVRPQKTSPQRTGEIFSPGGRRCESGNRLKQQGDVFPIGLVPRQEPYLFRLEYHRPQAGDHFD